MKRFLVTGSTSGVGREVALELAALGHTVVAVGRNVDRLRELYPTGMTLLLDFEAVEPVEITERVRAAGPFDGIFHAAGSELVQSLRAMTDEQLYKQLAFYTSSFALLRAAGSRHVVSDGASVVIMSSVAAARGTPGMAGYAGARGAVESMARVAAAEHAARHVRVNCLAAGAFESPMHWRITKRLPEAGQVAYQAKHPLGFGMVREVRDAALFLLGEQSRWITGSVMTVDGGFLAA